LPGKYAKPQGCILLAKNQKGQTIGCVALRPIEHKVCEMKRLYVKPEYRGNGIGKNLARRICEIGKEVGYDVMKLDTLENMKAALQVYE
jgi:putative acetyltransferase